MISPLPYPIHTIAEVAVQISQGEDPWFALGGFLHDWWCDAKDYRQDLITEPPAPFATVEGRRWVALCAAVVEELCSRTAFPSPAWINRQDYILEQPWFYPSNPVQHDWLLATTPEAFRRRNIFIGGSVLDNKYELHHLFESKPRWAVWSDQELEYLQASNESAEAEIVP
ncbi:MAG: hypothetical protein PVS3B1_14780 [Ktedonobacteraceae bacterium]